jgi:hypothetical protein
MTKRTIFAIIAVLFATFQFTSVLAARAEEPLFEKKAFLCHTQDIGGGLRVFTGCDGYFNPYEWDMCYADAPADDFWVICKKAVIETSIELDIHDTPVSEVPEDITYETGEWVKTYGLYGETYLNHIEGPNGAAWLLKPDGSIQCKHHIWSGPEISYNTNCN